MNVVYQVRYYDDDIGCHVPVAGLPVYTDDARASEICNTLKYHPNNDELVIDVITVEVV